jgi:prolyl-tRNA editing enzyme YbaK/EbsC (Cys-tRNA(Pro) deacylase)
MTSAVERVQLALAERGVEARIVEFAESTRTAAEAAAAIGTTVERIVKSLIFAAGDELVVVLASGVNRVDTERLGQLLERPIGRATAAKVREATGFAIGGVPPLGHDRPLPVVVDQDLLQYDQVWAAAGTPNSVFPIAPAELVRITEGRVAAIREEPAAAG